MNIRLEPSVFSVLQADADAIAEEELRCIRASLGRGRYLLGVDLGDLDDLFVAAFAKWMADPGSDAARRERDDAISEYAMRAYRPPYRLIQKELAVPAQIAAGACEFSRSDTLSALLAAMDIGPGVPS
jgi:hypothetical protein